MNMCISIIITAISLSSPPSSSRYHYHVIIISPLSPVIAVINIVSPHVAASVSCHIAAPPHRGHRALLCGTIDRFLPFPHGYHN
eukprot:SAG25_NODE_385_length_8737_cov_82.994675_1_plen_84_part_00